MSKNSCFGFQEAEAFALYHKALDLQKHDRFEESAKAYHELLGARLLREVRHQHARRQTLAPGSLGLTSALPRGWITVDTVFPLSPSASPPGECVLSWFAGRVD